MKYFQKSLLDYVKTVSRPMLADPEIREHRIFLSSFPPEIVYLTGRELTEYWLNAARGRRIEFVFKIGNKLWRQWLSENGGVPSPVLEQIRSAGWVDAENRLTHYRNMKWRPSGGGDGLVVMLVGVETATDRASLADFYYVDADVLWNEQLEGEFKAWIEPFLLEKQVSPEPVHLDRMDALLRILYRHGAGDLIKVSGYLDAVDLTGALDSHDALEALYGGLGYWGLPFLKQMDKGKWRGYVHSAIDFFSYRPYLSDGPRRKALQKVAEFRDREEKDDIALDLRGAFQSEADLLDCLKAYIEKNDHGSAKRLLKFDFAVIWDVILGYKKPVDPGDDDGNGEDPPEATGKGKTVYGPPLEAILTALWRTLTAFKKQCMRKGGPAVSPAEALKAIRLKGIEFTDFEEDNIELIRGCIGGIDDYLSAMLSGLKIETEDGGNAVLIESRLLVEDELKIRKNKARTPKFEFEVYIEGAPRRVGVRLRFKWMLPDTHGYRNLWEMADIVLSRWKRINTNCMPVFHIPHYGEMFLAPNETEAHRVLRTGLNHLDLRNLLDAPELSADHPVGALLADLCRAYGDFLQCFVEKGYFHAINTQWLAGGRLFEKYETALKTLIGADDMELREIMPIVYKAFLIAESPAEDRKEAFPWDGYISSAIVTGLHPAMIEMLQHRETFLVHAWLKLAAAALNHGAEATMTERKWQDVRDLAALSHPLFCVLADADKRLDTKVDALGMIHRIGRPERRREVLSAKILQSYDVPEDEDVHNEELFRESRESRVICRLLEEYARIYPHADDGMSLAILNIANVQAVIAGIDAYLREKLEGRADDEAGYPPYHFELAVFMNVTESREVSRWLSEWQKHWDPAQGATRWRDYYRHCRLSVVQKVVAVRDDYLAILSMKDFAADIAVLSRFMDLEGAGNDLTAAAPYRPDWEAALKFPILEMPRPADDRHFNRNLRGRIVSNRRFRLATLHSELSARMRNPYVAAEQEHIAISQGNYAPWADIIDLMHQRSSWVLCLDPSVDEWLVGRDRFGNADRRQIIGFSSGVGSHGELNYTISTERSTLDDVKRLLQKKINDIFGPWAPEETERIAGLLVKEAQHLSGLSLVRATGKGEKIRDLIAYAMVRRCLPPAGDADNRLCDGLIVLDAFSHWFENADSGRGIFPDLLRIEAFIESDGVIGVHAHLFECKISRTVSRHLEKARSQLENGLRHLADRFRPRLGEDPSGRGTISRWMGNFGIDLGSLDPRRLLNRTEAVDDASNPPVEAHRFDQRFWWAQLQRLIANKTVVGARRQPAATAALEALGDGSFRIYWRAAAVTVWSERDESRFGVKDRWDFEHKGVRLTMPVISCGRMLLQRLGRGEDMFLPLEGPEGDESDPDPSPGDDDGGSSPSAPPSQPPPIQGAPPTDPPAGEATAPSFRSAAPFEMPPRIFLGRTDADKEIFWEFGHPELTNRHVLIFGKSGVGKTYAIQSLLYELGCGGQRSVIIDYTNGFLPNHLETAFKSTLEPTTHLVRREPLPINPFRKQRQEIDGLAALTEDAHTVGGRITSVIHSVYSSVGEQQRSILSETIAEGLDHLGESFDFTLLLEHLKEKGGSGATLASKIGPLVNMKLFGRGDRRHWDALYGDYGPTVHILQLAGVPRDIARIATEFILWDLYDYAANAGDKDRPLPMVLDEIQNLDHRLEAPLGKFLTEGRKFGLSLILATQTLSNLKADERDRLFQASHKLFFKPAETEVKEYARILEQGGATKVDVWATRLNRLNKGECFSMGPVFNPATEALEDRALKIKITALEARVKRGGSHVE